MDVNAGAPPTRPLKGTRVSATIRDALNAQHCDLHTFRTVTRVCRGVSM